MKSAKAADVFQNMCSQKFCNIHRKAPMLESLSIKLQPWNPATLSKTGSKHRCFPVKIAKYLRIAFFIEHIRWLLLSIIDAKRYRKTSIGFVLVSLLLTLNIFHSSFYCMHSSLWAGKRRLRSELGCFLSAKKSYLSKNKN